MSRLNIALLCGVWLLFCAGCLTGCAKPEAEQCREGTLNCACFPNRSCHTGLSCIGGACVDSSARSDVGPADDSLDDTDQEPDCARGQTVCDGVCADTNVSRLHCGQCGQMCTNGGICRAGTCITPRVSAGSWHSCAIGSSGDLTCWGRDDHGRIAPPFGTYTQVSIAAGMSCALATDGTIECWGHRRDDTHLPPSGSFIQLSAGGSCGIRTDRTAECWGAYQPLPPEGEFTQVSTNLFQTCGIRPDRTLECWGGEESSQPPSGTFRQVSIGRYHGCAIRTDGTVACWGLDDEGRASPPAGEFVQISAESSTMGVRPDGTVACWGCEASDLSAPSGTFKYVSLGGGHACGEKSDASIVCWGNDSVGQASPPPGL